MNPTQLREEVTRLARSDPEAAARVAAGIPDPWFRTQALAWAGRFAPRAEAGALLRQAFAAARTADDAYAVVGASAWPLRAALEVGLDPRRDCGMPDLAREAEAIAHPVRRSSALFLAWQAAAVAPGPLEAGLRDALVAACRGSESWRPARILSDLVALLAPRDPVAARGVATAMRPGRWRGVALRALEAPVETEPRPFFW